MSPRRVLLDARALPAPTHLVKGVPVLTERARRVQLASINLKQATPLRTVPLGQPVALVLMFLSMDQAQPTVPAQRALGTPIRTWPAMPAPSAKPDVCVFKVNTHRHKEALRQTGLAHLAKPASFSPRRHVWEL